MVALHRAVVALHRALHRAALALLVALLLLLALAATACDALPSQRAMPTFVPPAALSPSANPSGTDVAVAVTGGKAASTARVARGALAQVVKARGRMTSVREAVLYFPLQGVVNKILVASGDQVAQGTPLMALDTFQLEQDVTNARFALDKANLDLKQAQARLSASDYKIEIATNVYSRTLQTRNQTYSDYLAVAPAGMNDSGVKTRFDRFQQADKEFLTASIELNNARIEKQSAGLAIETTTLAIAQGQKVLEQAQTRSAGAQIVAPYAGLVVSVDKNLGEVVQAFEPVGGIADPSQLQVEASIGESAAAGLGLGQAAVVVVDGFPDQKHAGKIKEIAAKASIYQGQSVYRVVVAFDNPAQVPASLQVGVDLSLVQQVKRDVLSVPSTALASDGARKYVTAVRDGKPQRVEVQVGIAGETQTEIVAGLAENDQVLLP